MTAWLKNLFRLSPKPLVALPEREAISLSGQDRRNMAEALKNQGNEHYAKGELELAAACYRQAIETDPGYADAYNNLGAIHRQQNRLDEALACYREAAALNPALAKAHYNLGSILAEKGDYDAAANAYKQAIAANPGYADALFFLSVTLQALGQLDNAAAGYRRTLEIKPDFAEGHNNLGVTLQGLGRFDDAVASFTQALKIKPDFADVYNNLGNALREHGQLGDAMASYAQALEIKPDFVEAHNNLGNALREHGRLDDAVASFRRALEIKPDFAIGYSNLGIALQDLGQLDGAVASYRRALEIAPDFADAHNNLGNVLRDIGQLDDAMASYAKALEIKPDFADAHNNLGSTLLNLGRLDNAVASLRRALEVKPDFADAHCNLGYAMRESGRLDDALASYRRAQETNPDLLKYAINVYLMLPIISDTLDTITFWRERYQTGIAALTNTPGSLEDPGNHANSSSFYLAYHNYNDRSVMESLCRLFRERLPKLTYTSPHVSGWCPPIIRKQRIRVGFLSEFLVGHTIGKLYLGFIHHLDRSRFEVVVIRTAKAKQDGLRQSIDNLADKNITLPTRLEGQQQAVIAEKLDVLFYPDIGMSPTTYFLAYARLAPVQAVAWGHPESTGLNSLDYFVSAAPIEPEDAEEHYTERLIRLNRIPCFFQPLLAPTQISSRTMLGLPETGVLYGCPQSLFKFHPDFDAVLAAIAEGDPFGRIVLLEGLNSAWSDQLRARWAKTFPVLLERVIFLPRVDLNRFMELMACMDVLLDPIHFGSGNTLYEAMVYGTPIVTWPGRFMRGRIVAAAYRQMGVADAPIAQRLEDYAPLALALGRDPERRRALRSASLEAAERELFADMRVVREFEAFLEAAVTAAGRGKKLPVGWKPEL
ncbi:MAG: tetratricopeptide repeat protein [Sulfuricellaceae bacterium]